MDFTFVALAIFTVLFLIVQLSNWEHYRDKAIKKKLIKEHRRKGGKR